MTTTVAAQSGRKRAEAMRRRRRTLRARWWCRAPRPSRPRTTRCAGRSLRSGPGARRRAPPPPHKLLRVTPFIRRRRRARRRCVRCCTTRMRKTRRRRLGRASQPRFPARSVQRLPRGSSPVPAAAAAAAATDQREKVCAPRCNASIRVLRCARANAGRSLLVSSFQCARAHA